MVDSLTMQNPNRFQNRCHSDRMVMLTSLHNRPAMNILPNHPIYRNCQVHQMDYCMCGCDEYWNLSWTCSLLLLLWFDCNFHPNQHLSDRKLFGLVAVHFCQLKREIKKNAIRVEFGPFFFCCTEIARLNDSITLVEGGVQKFVEPKWAEKKKQSKLCWCRWY